MYGTVPDGYGIRVSNITMQRLILMADPILDSVIGGLLFNNLTSAVNSLPGSRVFLYSISNFFSAFDRLEFYYYHKQNLTYYSNVLLSNINTISLEQGSLPQQLLEVCEGKF